VRQFIAALIVDEKKKSGDESPHSKSAFDE
jgi:hypothetical protein